MTEATPRVPPLAPPFSPEDAAIFDRIMPPGVPPLSLFTTLARVPRVWERFRAGSLLDRGPVPLRLREIAIDRTSARAGNAYEWGVHVAFFAERAKLGADEVAALATGPVDALCWGAEERLVVALADALHETADIPDELWAALAETFSVEQILELIALCGFYRTVAYFCRGLRLAPEAYAAPLPGAA
jgi:alkylhydroperoxidase family enzyme